MPPVLDEFGREIPDAHNLMHDGHAPDNYLSTDDHDPHDPKPIGIHDKESEFNPHRDTDRDMDRDIMDEDRFQGPSGRGGGGGRYSRSRSRSRSHSRDLSGGGNGSIQPSFSRDRGRDRGRKRSRSRSLSRGRSRSRSDDFDRSPRFKGRSSSGYYRRDAERERGRSRDGYDRHSRGRERGRGRSSRSRSPSKGGSRLSHGNRNRSRSYSPDSRRGSSGGSRFRGGNERSRSYSHSQSIRRDYGNRRKSNDSSRKSRKSQPSQLYVDEPLLCQFLWEKDQEQELEEKLNTTTTNGEDIGAMDPSADPPQMKTEDDATDANAGDQTMEGEQGPVKKENEDPNADASNDALQPTDSTLKQEQVPAKSQAVLDEEYKAYNKAYCLKYVRSFFNQHLDDTWFRERYSPLEYRKKIQRQSERAVFEATCILNEVNKSCEELKGSTEGAMNAVPSFVVDSRLGGGQKPNASDRGDASVGSGMSSSHTNLKRKYSTTSDTPHFDAVEASGLPKSHLFSFLQENTAMQIMDIPSNISDEHISRALKEHAGGDATLLPLQVFSSTIVPGVCSAITETSNLSKTYMDDGTFNADSKGNDLYHRSAWAVFQSEAAKDKLMENLIGAYLESESGRHARDSRFVPKVIELSVDCSDAYGRYDIDADGEGSAPAASAGGDEGAAVDVTGSTSQSPRIPIRRVSVFVSSSSPLESQTATVLSAAVSSLKRVENDKESCIKIARTLDEWKGIAREAQLDTILRTLFSSEFNYASADEDMLDVSIAYLRRVHLFTFYNGCIAASNVGNCLTTSHPSSVIHLRLKGADEILQKAKEDHAEMYDDLLTPGNDGEKPAVETSMVLEDGQGEENKLDEPKDMLVMRLDESIKDAIEHLPSDADIGSPFVVNETVDAVASEIESLESKAKREWIEKHAMIDGDGRARCSFHFCRKLFKDKSFLEKHLMKKHGEYLNAEVAKSHDGYMMKWWDEEQCRPVPRILIDCGSKFGLVSETVVGASEPCAQDPEPDLWRKEQERVRQVEEEEERYREERAKAAELSERNRGYNEGGDMDRGGGPAADGGPGGEKNFGNSNFVDVDDMKDEKIQLSFNNVEAAKPPKKKKRKKKKLL